MLYQSWSVWQSLIWAFLSLMNCLHLVVNPMYLLSGSLLLIVDFANDTATSCRVLFTCLDVVYVVFFTFERIHAVIYHYVAEFTSAFFFSQNGPNC